MVKQKLDKLNVGQRVASDFLGSGTIVKVIPALTPSIFAYMVEFDTTPPMEYNMSNNPCFMFRADLLKI